MSGNPTKFYICWVTQPIWATVTTFFIKSERPLCYRAKQKAVINHTLHKKAKPSPMNDLLQDWGKPNPMKRAMVHTQPGETGEEVTSKIWHSIAGLADMRLAGQGRIQRLRSVILWNYVMTWPPGSTVIINDGRTCQICGMQPQSNTFIGRFVRYTHSTAHQCKYLIRQCYRSNSMHLGKWTWL